MAYALRYYKEVTHADGTIIRLEIHKKDSTAGAIEIGGVMQGLSLQIQGQQGDIDTPIVKTSLSMTFADAQDLGNGKKNGFWEEFYTPDAVLWKVVLKAKKAQETAFRTIWGGYVTPDSFSETLSYRGSINIIARDNIGHMQDFPFDAEGDADGMISLYDLVEMAWSKIDSPMFLEWRGNEDGAIWMQAENGVVAYNTLMNVSAFEGLNWYEAIEKALYSYGVVMRYVGDNRVQVSTLRYMPFYGQASMEDLPVVQPVFVAGAQRELVPAVKRIEESVGYDLGEEYQPRIDTQDFSGNTFNVETSWGTVENIAWSLLQSAPMSAFGWYNETPFKTLAFNPNAYEVDDMLSDSDKEDLHKYTCVLTGSKDDNTHSLSYAMSVNAEDFAINVTFGKFLSRLTHGYGDYFLGYPVNEPPEDYSVRFAVSVQANGITYYLTENGVWSTEFASQKVVVSGDKMSVNVPLSGKYTGRVSVSFTFLNIDTSEEAVRVKQILALSLSSTSNKPMLENNTISTNYQEGNNVILTRDPELAPALNTTALPAFIKNGIFYRQGDVILPARKWSWGSGSEQQMAVWNHLQLLSYYAKPNNLISGTIVNADITRAKAIYMWHGAEHILVSGTYNFLNGHIESAMLREFARYEDMWSEVAGAGLPDTEQDSRSNVEGGASSGGATSTYSSTTNVNIGSGGGGTGASYLNDLLDVDTTGVVAQSVLYYNGTSWVDMSLPTLLNPYLKADIAAQTYAKSSDLSALTTRVRTNEGSIASLQSGKADKATTLAGYGIKDAYTTTQVDEKISDLDESKADKTELEKYLLLESENQTIKGNIRIEGNLIVTGDTATGGEGGSVPVGITGILVDGMTYRDKNADGVIDITDAFEGLQEKIDLTNYYTRVEVDAQVSAINNEVSNKASQSDLDKVSGRVSTLEKAGYATQTYVNTAINNLNIGQYATKTYVGEQITALNIGQYLKSATAESTYAKITSLTAVDNRLKGIEAYFATSEDAGTQIDKWNEIVAFLDATEGTTLAGILEAYTLKSVYEAFVSSTNTALADRYTKAQVDGIVTTINNSITSVDNKYASTKTWADTLASLIVNENGNIRIKTNLIVNGDTASGGGSGETAIGITGILLNGTTYRDENSDGIIDLGTITSGLTSVNWSDVQGRPTSLSQFNNDLGLGTLAYKNGLTASDIPDLSGKYLSTAGGTITGLLTIQDSSPRITFKTSATTTIASLGIFSNKLAMYHNGDAKYYDIYHTGNFNPADYLPKTGGTIKGSTAIPLLVDTSASSVGVNLRKSNVDKLQLGWDASSGVFLFSYASGKTIGIKDDGTPYYNGNTLYHTGNFNPANYLPLSGGTITGASGNYTPLIVKTTSLSEVWIAFEDTVGVTHIGSARGVPSINSGSGNKTIIHSGNVGDFTFAAAVGKSQNVDSVYNLEYRSVSGGAGVPSVSQYGSLLTLPYRTLNNNGTPDFATQIFLPNGDDSTFANDMFFRTSVRTSWNEWQRILTPNNIGSYNAGSATKLATPRTIWGQSFDGTGNIGGNLLPSASLTYYCGNPTNSWFGIYTRGIWSPSGQNFNIGANDSNHIIINSSGNVTIGSSDLCAEANGNPKLYVNGRTILAGGTTAVGDMSLQVGATAFGVGPKIYFNIGGRGNVAMIQGKYDAVDWNATNPAAGSLVFSTFKSDTVNTAMTINSSGNVLIGTTTDNGAKLQVNGTARVTGAVTMSSTLNVGGASTFNGDVRINGNLIVTGDTASGGSAGTTTGVEIIPFVEINLYSILMMIQQSSDGKITQTQMDSAGLTEEVITQLMEGRVNQIKNTYSNGSSCSYSIENNGGQILLTIMSGTGGFNKYQKLISTGMWSKIS